MAWATRWPKPTLLCSLVSQIDEQWTYYVSAKPYTGWLLCTEKATQLVVASQVVAASSAHE